LELRHLRYFVALAEELHFGRAAGRLSITQPPLSLSIRSLEDELCVQLFERNSRRVRLTPAGEAFFARAKDVLAHAESAQQLARAIAGGRAGRLQIAYSPAVACLGVAERVQAYASANAGTELFVREQSSRDQVDSLRSASLDIGFVKADVDASGLTLRNVANDTFAVCVPAAHTLAAADAVDLAVLRDLPFVMHAHEGAGRHRAQAMAWCETAGFVPRISASATQTLGVMRLVASGAGIAIVRASFARAGLAGVAFVRVREPASPLLGCAIAWHPKRSDAHVRKFVDAATATAPTSDATRAVASP
jgi:DNA-binding transcriptional LysR family regulator